VVVIATDVAARGLDLLKVGCVVHYDGARTVDTFVHRAGRTAVRHIVEMLSDPKNTTVMNKGFGLESLKVNMLIHPLAV
jgi:superfamily II DNA/RNA helicase